MKTKKKCFKDLLIYANIVVASLFCHIAIAQPTASELEWKLPYEKALQEATTTGKPMLVLVGNVESNPDCQKFIQTVSESPAFIAFTKENLVVTQLLYSAGTTKEEQSKMSRHIEELNIPGSFAVIITNSSGLRIGELSISVESVSAFIADIKTIIAKAPKDGRLKYSEVSLLDKKFVPEKTYTTPVPKFSKEKLKGRYINFMTTVTLHFWENTRARLSGRWSDEGKRNTTENAIKLRNSVEAGFPGARITWAWTWGSLNSMDPRYVELRKLMVQFHKKYGDEITFLPGNYFANKFNTQEQVKKDLHDGLELISKMIGDGYRPKSVVAGHMSSETMRYMADNEGIHTVQGQIWSQFNIDGQDGDGGIPYPYYASKQHFLKPAQTARGGEDFLDVVNIDGWSVNFFAARLKGIGKDYNSRVGIGPIENAVCYGATLGLRQMLHTSEIYFNDQAVADNGYGFLTVIWELHLFEWLKPAYLPGWLKAIREKYPDTQMLSMGEFGDLWRKHNPDNSRINLKFVERGNGNMPSQEEGQKIDPRYKFHGSIFRPEMEIRWYFNKGFRFATIQNWKENGPKLVMDYTRYNQPYKEPSGNVIQRHWDILDIINQKESRPQDTYKPFTELPQEEQQKILKWYPDAIK
jgi:Domain of Unknown Function with PDB structure (DUF3863)/Domain of Unknown Function with PDB structure (DUF3864)